MKYSFSHIADSMFSPFLDPNISDNDDNTKTGLTALASFPGSGNTWLRYLLQQSTGRERESIVFAGNEHGALVIIYFGFSLQEF